MEEKHRTEEEIFAELSLLCAKPGFVHVIAYLCFRDNTIRYADTLKAEDMLHQFSMERLLRTEISSLIGLLIKKEIDFSLPEPNVMQSMIEEADALLEEMHTSMSREFFSSLDPEKMSEKGFNPFSNASVLRESIFYGGESAYNFQYRELAEKKYSKDDEWFLNNKGYSNSDIRDIVGCIAEIQNAKIMLTIDGVRNKHPNDWSILPAFTLTAKEIDDHLNIGVDRVNAFLETFSITAHGCNDDFQSISDFNISNAYPMIKATTDEYLLFQLYSLAEAYYETPFYWFNEDESYLDTAMTHRGEFTEEFSEERLKNVFGSKNVFSNINIVDQKGGIAGEIDVLVAFSNRAIVLQAKSKKLTLASRKGNDNCLKDDFKKAIQESYDQGYSCASLLEDENYELKDSNSNTLNIRRKFKEIYIFCVVSDHYPALSFQSRQFLRYEKTGNILPPFVMDVFLLDVMTEMLHSPLQFLSYINRRVLYADKILASHELVVLSYHLKQNLWMSGEYDLFQLGDDISTDLDIAMVVRREGIEGNGTPDGILTRFQGTAIGDLISQIERLEDPGTIDLGFMLLLLGEDTVHQISEGINEIARLARHDGKCHDLTVSIGEGSTGLTIHCNKDPIDIAGPSLERHSERRKYSQKAKEWFGINIDPENKHLRFGVGLNYDWEQSDEMDGILEDMPKPQKTINFGTKIKSRKVGRNEKCPCGSGKKYKKCCLNR